MANLSRSEFAALVARERARTPTATLAVPIVVRLLADQLTPVVAYRRLVAPDRRADPSFLLESVEGGERQGRYSILGAQPVSQLVARRHAVEFTGRELAGPHGDEWFHVEMRDDACPDPLAALRTHTRHVRLVVVPGTPACFHGGWVGYASYDSVRYGEPTKLSFENAPSDDRGLPDLSFGFYDGVVVFDHVEKVVLVVGLALVLASNTLPEAEYDRTVGKMRARIAALERHTEPLRSGELTPADATPAPLPSNLTRAEHAKMVAKAMEYIRAGDIFQVVIGQRFERTSEADPFDVYRALRTVNPSPYMVYMQSPGCILVASSPEILCRVRALGGPAVPAGSLPLGGPRAPLGIPSRSPCSLEDRTRWDNFDRRALRVANFIGKDPYPPGVFGLDAIVKKSRRNLPHYQIPGATYFVTWRCATERRLSAEDRSTILTALRHFEGKRCQSYAGCVMPDHVHWIVRPLEGEDLLKLMADVKHFTARTINKRIGASGAWWQDEGFDCILRDGTDFGEALEYLLCNPVEAGLCAKPSDYLHSFVHQEIEVVERICAVGSIVGRRDEDSAGTAEPPKGKVPTGTVGPHRSEDPAGTAGPPKRFIVTNRPLAGTRKRGKTPEEDLALERELLADEKERAEHIMLVDLGRNDVGRVAEPGSVALESAMNIERYSHVMHISSTVTGVLREGLDCWDALRAALPVGTISGAPKIRAMQIIDELEPVRRGPYGGGMGYVGLDGQMDIALTLRTMVVPTAMCEDAMRSAEPAGPPKTWTYHLQAAGGIVADSQAEAEYMETVNKAAALARAIDVAERAFGASRPSDASA